MVTLKIQSLDDIIRAYLCGLGFAGDKAAATIKQLKTKLTENGDGDAAVEALDHLLYQSARQIFKNSSLDKPQLIALLKFCYLRSNGAQNGAAACLSLRQSTAKWRNSCTKKSSMWHRTMFCHTWSRNR